MPLIRESDVAPEEPERLRRIGKNYATEQTVAQLDRTISGIGTYRDVLAPAGVSPAIEAYLASIRESLLAARADRADAVTGKKVTNAAVLDAMFVGKAARFVAHGHLDTARFFLAVAGNKAAVEIEKVLKATRSSGSDPQELETQLTQLVRVVANADVRGALEASAEPLETQLNGAIAALNVARESKTSTRGTPEETDYLDMLDGLAVELCRRVRKMARAAAKQLRQPAIARELDLRELYKTTGRRVEEDEGGGGGGPTPA